MKLNKTQNEDALRNRLIEIRRLADLHGWREVSFDHNIRTLIFEKPDEEKKPDGSEKEPMKINVWYSTGKIATVVNHPKKKRNQMYRTCPNTRFLESIFENPRLHTNRGYRRKHNR